MDIQQLPTIEFRVPTRVTIEPGCVQSLAAVAHRLGARSALFVTDPGLVDLPVATAAIAGLRDAGIRTEVIGDVEANPRTTTAERVAAAARGTDLVVGFGGGSVMDAAKAAAMLATNDGPALDFVGKNVFTKEPLPFLAVPTTCGTGSEVTWVSVLTDPARGVKVSIKGDGMFPNAALVDADLLAGLPPRLVAETGIDALTHALEATTGTCRNPATDALAEASIDLTFRYLARAVRDVRGDAEARAGVARAATLAGMAFSNADVAAVHCLSETLGGFFDVAHGLANAVLLVPVFRAHGSSVEARLLELGRRLPLAGCDVPPEAFLDAVAQLVAEVGIPGFDSFGIDPADDARIAAGAVANGSNDSNPRPMGVADYEAILASLRR